MWCPDYGFCDYDGRAILKLPAFWSPIGPGLAVERVFAAGRSVHVLARTCASQHGMRRGVAAGAQQLPAAAGRRRGRRLGSAHWPADPPVLLRQRRVRQDDVRRAGAATGDSGRRPMAMRHEALGRIPG